MEAVSTETHSESSTSGKASEDGANIGAWLKVSAVAAASALVGGLAAAWFYRKTLSRLQHAQTDSNFGIPEDTDDENA